MKFVSGPISCELICPVVDVRVRHTRTALASVTMPKAAMNKHDPSEAHERKVRLSGKCGEVESISVSHAENEASNDHFRRRISRLDRTHSAAASGVL